MFKLLGLLCVLGVIQAVPIPDDDDYRYGIFYRSADPVKTYSSTGNQVGETRHSVLSYATPVFKAGDTSFEIDDDAHRFFYSAQPQAIEVQQPVVNSVQPNTYSANVYRFDDDRYDFDDDDYRFVYASSAPATAAAPAPAVAPAQRQPTLMTYSANSGATRQVAEQQQPYTMNAPNAGFAPATRTAPNAGFAPATRTAPNFGAAPATRTASYDGAAQVASYVPAAVVRHDFDDSQEVFRTFTPSNGGTFYSANEFDAFDDDDDFVSV